MKENNVLEIAKGLWDVLNKNVDEFLPSDDDLRRAMKENPVHTVFDDKLYELDEIEKVLTDFVKTHPLSSSFLKGQIFINEDFSCKANLFFFVEQKNEWYKVSVLFRKLVLDKEMQLQLSDAPPLEFGFSLSSEK